MIMGTAVIIAGDSNIFALTYGCFLSLQPLRKEGVSLCFLDTGVTELQADVLKPLLDHSAQFNEALSVIPTGEKRPYWKAQGCRPFLPSYFVGHEVYVWLDSDTWVQDLSAVRELADLASKHGAAIVPELDVHYEFVLNFEDSRRYFGMKFDFVRFSYGQDYANATLTLPYLNTGVFAISTRSGLFAEFEKELTIVYQRGYTHMAEQICLNRLLFRTGKFVPLNALYNWMCNLSQPLLNNEGHWTIPRPPFSEIKIVHLSGKNKLAKFKPMGLLFDRGSYLDAIGHAVTGNDGLFV
jgi:hypothetical protein